MTFRKTTAAFFIVSMYAGLSLAQEAQDQVPPEDLLKEVSKATVPGWKQVGETQCLELKQRQVEEIQVELPKSSCYTFIALATSGISDLSMSIFVGSDEVASDRISGRQPTAKWCSAQQVTVSAKLTAYSGSGVLAFGVYAEPKNIPQKADKVGGQSDDIVANRVRQLHARFGKGRAAISPLLRGNLVPEKTDTFKVKLKAGHCYTMIAAGDNSVRALEITFLDGKERELAKNTSKSFFASLDTKPCIKSGGTYTIAVKMLAGSGQFGTQIFSD